MRLPEVNDHVRLTRDIPELSLYRGELGVVRSQWCAPELAFEVEFRVAGLDETTRALLMSDQIAVDDSQPRQVARVGLKS